LKPSLRRPASAPKRWLKSGASKTTVARLDPAASLAVAEQHFVVSPMSADWRHAPDHHRDPNVEYSLIPGIVRISVGLLAGTIAGCTGVRLDPVPTGFWKRLAPNCFVIISVLMLFTSCAKAPMTYSLQRWGTTSVVVPPNQKATNENSGLLVVELKNARRKATTTDCDIDGLVALRWRGKAVEINLRSESYFAERSEPTQSGGSMSGMYLDPLQDIATFHSQLLVLQARGCLSFREVSAPPFDCLPLPAGRPLPCRPHPYRRHRRSGRQVAGNPPLCGPYYGVTQGKSTRREPLTLLIDISSGHRRRTNLRHRDRTRLR